MAVYRQIHTCFWEDDKVLDEMDLEEKFFYLYLLTNQRVKQCGCYDISWKKITLETTLPKSKIESLLEKFENEYNIIKYNKKTKEILILNFYKYNWTTSPKVKCCIKSELNDIKDQDFIEYINKMIEYKYGIDSVSIDLGEEEKENKKNKKKNKNKSESEFSHESDFVAPTLADIFSYSTELGIDNEDYCKKFFNNYESTGWKIGKNHIKNWKAKFQQWVEQDKEKGNIKIKQKEEYDTRQFFEDENGVFKYDSEGVKHYV